ncbi:MAG: mechanosensitive ion channel family protein [Halobacteriales archaeon]
MSGAVALQAAGAIAQALENAGLGASYADAVGAAITFVLAFVVLYVLGRTVVMPILGRFMDAREMDAHARKPIRKLARGLVVFVALAVAFGFAGYGSILTSLATIAAAGTLAVGFALQDVIKNFVAGVFIFTDKPFRIGDWIEWGDHSGVVEDISLRVTRVRTFDNELLTVPNSQLSDDVIKNPVAKGQLRLKFTFGIAYDDDVERASEIIVEAAEDHAEILDDPAPSVRLTELADSYVGLQARIWIDDPARADFVRIRSEYVEDVKRRFDEADVTIPFPQRTLHGGISVGDSPSAAALEGGSD